MKLNRDDVPYYLAFVLLDEAHRDPSGKRQRTPMKGFWMSGQINAGLRGSDARLRQSICIAVQRRLEGKSVTKAAAVVASMQGRHNIAQVNVIRNAYYEWRVDPDPGYEPWNLFLSQFLNWRKWVFASDEETFKVVLGRYRTGYGEPRRRRLAEWIERLQNDRVQRARNRSWLLEKGEAARARIDSNHWDPESDWQSLAVDLWILGRLHAGIGEGNEAKTLLDRALHIWKSHEHKLPKDSISSLEDEMAHLVRNYSPNPQPGQQRPG